MVNAALIEGKQYPYCLAWYKDPRNGLMTGVFLMTLGVLSHAFYNILTLFKEDHELGKNYCILTIFSLLIALGYFGFLELYLLHSFLLNKPYHSRLWYNMHTKCSVLVPVLGKLGYSPNGPASKTNFELYGANSDSPDAGQGPFLNKFSYTPFPFNSLPDPEEEKHVLQRAMGIGKPFLALFLGLSFSFSFPFFERAFLNQDRFLTLIMVLIFSSVLSILMVLTVSADTLMVSSYHAWVKHGRPLRPYNLEADPESLANSNNDSIKSDIITDNGNEQWGQCSYQAISHPVVRQYSPPKQ